MNATLTKGVSLALVDDHLLFLEGLSLLIRRHIDGAEVSTYSRPRDVLEAYKIEAPDVLITDLSMPHDGGGMALIQYMRDLHKDTPILVVSMNIEPSKVKACLSYGATGFVPKDAPQHQLVEAIQTVLKGESYLSPSLKEAVRGITRDEEQKVLRSLTFREKEILGLVAREYANHEIAESLNISKRTVETHRKNIMRKLDVKNSVGLAKFAFRHGIAG